MTSRMNIRNGEIKRLLFVCTANICRSPMAAVFFLDAYRKIPDYHSTVLVGSAGTLAYKGAPALHEVQKVMAARGFDLSKHRSYPVTARVVSEASLILTMEIGHKEALRAEFPDMAGKIFLLSELSGAPLSVWDPVGGEMEDFEYSADFIQTLIQRGFSRILELIEG